MTRTLVSGREPLKRFQALNFIAPTVRAGSVVGARFRIKKKVLGLNLSKSIRLAVDSGKVELGVDKAKKIALRGEAKLIVVARNCPSENAADLRHYCRQSGTPLIEFPGTSIELGTVCGKPFSVSALSVLEEGNSDILQAVRT